MSRIVALLNRNGRPTEAGSLHKMIARMRPPESDGPRVWSAGFGGLAYQCLKSTTGLDDRQPAIHSPRLAVCIDGRLDNREELIGALAPDLRGEPADLSDAELVLACFRRFDESLATRLNGDFAIAIYDEEKRRLVLARDPMGVRPLYYWASGATFLAASEIKAILAHPEVQAHPDEAGLADLVVGGDPNELRLTCFRDVARVLPGHTVVATSDRVREFRHWDFDPMRQIRCRSVGEYAEALRSLFEQAVRRRLRSTGKVAVLVSGGLDSSGILCQAEMLRRAGAPVAPALGMAQVFPDGGPADEKRYLTDIETQYGLEIRRLAFTALQYLDDERLHWLTESPKLRWDAEPRFMGAARELGCSTVLDGNYGDSILYSHAHLFELARRLRWVAFQRALRVLSRSMTDCSPALLRSTVLLKLLRHMVPDGLMRLARSVRQIFDIDRSPRWYAERLRQLAYQRSQRQRRPRGPFGSLHAELCYTYFRAAHVMRDFEEANKFATSYGLERAYPFVDRDLVAFTMAIPAEVLNWKGVYKGLYREAMFGLLPESIRLRYWKADFTPLDNDAAAAGYRAFERERSDWLAIKYGYVDSARLLPTVSRHMRSLTGEKMLPAMQLTSLIGLELWLRAFFPDGLSVETRGSMLTPS